MKNRDYMIFYQGRLMASGAANHWQVMDWQKAGYNVLRTNKMWCGKK